MPSKGELRQQQQKRKKKKNGGGAVAAEQEEEERPAVDVAALFKQHMPKHTAPNGGISSTELVTEERLAPYLVTQSSLSPALSDVLKNDLVLPYLIQFLQERDKAHLVYFWLAAEAFRLSDGGSSPAGCDDEAFLLRAGQETHTVADDALLDLNAAPPGGGQNPFKHPGDEDETEGFGGFQLSSDRVTVSGLLAAPPSGDSGDHLRQNALNLFTRYLSSDGPQSVGLPCNIQRNTLSAITGGGVHRPPSTAVHHQPPSTESCPPPSPNCFSEAQTYIYSVLSKLYPSFLASSQFLTYQLDRVTCRNLSLPDMLHSPLTMSHLMELVEELGLTPLLTCFLALHNYRLNFDRGQGRADAEALYTTYLADPGGGGGGGGHACLRFPQSVVDRVRERMGEPSVDNTLFDLPLLIVGDILQYSVVPLLVRGRRYKDIKRQLELAFYSAARPSSSPDCGGGAAASEDDTLLKGRDQQMPYRYPHDPYTVFATHSPAQPPAKGVTRNPSELSLGHVNAVGEYVPKYELSPGGGGGPTHKPPPPTVAQRLKNFVNGRDHSEVQYEAWVTAQHIVNQVNRETLASPSRPPAP